MMKKINDGILNSIGKVFDVEIEIKDGKLVIKENPSTKSDYLKAGGSLAISSAGAGLSYYIASVAGEEVMKGLFLTVMTSGCPGLLPFLCLADEAILGVCTTFSCFSLGIGIAIAGLVYMVNNFDERKKNAYKNSIKNLKEKFHSLFDGFEKKINQEYYAKKEKALNDIKNYLNMYYYPIELEKKKIQELLDEYNYLKNDIMDNIK